MGAHSWPLVFPWQTAISQSSTSPLCSHRSSYSPLCQNSLSDCSSTAGLVQVSAGDLCGFDTIYATFARCRKRRTAYSRIREWLLHMRLYFWMHFVKPVYFSVFFFQATVHDFPVACARCGSTLFLFSHLQYLQMKWPLLDVPGSAGLKDSRSPTPGHLVSKPPNRTKQNSSQKTVEFASSVRVRNLGVIDRSQTLRTAACAWMSSAGLFRYVHQKDWGVS